MIQEILSSDWFWYALGGFATNGFITQAAVITPTKKDDEVVRVLGTVFKALTGTFGMQKKS